MHKVSGALTLPLFGVEATRQLEKQAAALLPPHTLMRRAGLSAAQLCLALAPHAQRIWVACGPGNNGGDGLEAALHLHQGGKEVTVTWLGAERESSGKLPADALASLNHVRAAGVRIAEVPPQNPDFAIDALLGIGAVPRKESAANAGDPRLGQWLQLLRTTGTPVLSLDVPSGLDADTGLSITPDLIANYPGMERAGPRFTLSFLTVKPGLLTAQGRDIAGQLWWTDLDVALPAALAPNAWLLGRDQAARAGRSSSAHASHKGSFGDVAVVGGESVGGTHMAGAALLAARAALHAGAGRVFVSLLGPAPLTLDPQQPELMFRSPGALDPATQVVVCGCGGGDAVARELPRLLSVAPALVLDADALNAIARDPQLQHQLTARHRRRWRTVLTPHPLEAARLLGVQTADVQADRLSAAVRLAAQCQCVVVLKGSGTVIAAPGEIPFINPTGNARLATAGTGDVLAGMLGAALAQGAGALQAACQAVFRHGELADAWTDRHPGRPLTASALAENHQPDLQDQEQHQR